MAQVPTSLAHWLAADPVNVCPYSFPFQVSTLLHFQLFFLEPVFGEAVRGFEMGKIVLLRILVLSSIGSLCCGYPPNIKIERR